MPTRRRVNYSRHTRHSQAVQRYRENLTPQQRVQINERSRTYMQEIRAEEGEEQRSQRLASIRRSRRISRNRASDINRNLRNSNNQARMQATRALPSSFNRIAFEYDPEMEYCAHTKIKIGNMDKECSFCHALKFKNETSGMCCSSGKVVLPPLNLPPEPLKSLMLGETAESKLFLKKIRTFNSCFQMTSFSAHIISNSNAQGANFNSTFKIQGQVYHQIGSLLPAINESAKFLQIYFMGDEEEQINIRCQYNHIEQIQERAIVSTLETFLGEKNQLIQLFKRVSERLQNDNYMIIIKADKVPVGEHARRFNAPTVNEVGIVMVGDVFEHRDIRIMRRNNTLQVIQDTHRSYDALQYPLIFWEGEDGYYINIKQRDPVTGAETNKKVSSMNFYAYRIMIRTNQENHILKCRHLYHQYIVDMYAKIESERLRYIRYNQAKLRAEEYIHLRDAINSNVDGNFNMNDIGNMCILPSSYIGSPRHMQQYIQDAMTYVRVYGRPDLFITFTCNPQWIEITKYLLPGQLASDRHDITARVFKQKLKSLIDFIVKHHIFGETRCWMYSIEWQKRGLPHAHILVWLINKVRPEEIDKIISAEIPNRDLDPELFQIVTKNMIHGPCGVLNMNSPCMDNGKCTKRFPKDLLSDTITGMDGYPLYRRRSTEDGGYSFVLPARNQQNVILIDNRWVVPYSPLLSKTYKAHINVEFCNSVKSIKYICKYVNKGSDMAIFSVEGVDNHDEVTRYQMGRYISSNEAVWRILSFQIHEKYPVVTHLAIHLENGQRVYFNEQNVIERSLNPPKTTLTDFFRLCQLQDNYGTFARTLLYAEVPTYFTWNKPQSKWEPRKRGKTVPEYPGIFSTSTLGRLYTVHPSQRECFYLRLLLINVQGPTSFDYLKTVNGQLHTTNHDACRALQLLEEDSQWDTTLADAALSATPHQIRSLFAILLTTCFPTNPPLLWEKYKNDMSEDILHALRTIRGDIEINFTEEIYNEALVKLEDLCIIISNEPLIKLGMSSPNRPASDLFNRDIQREQSYNIDDLNTYVQTNELKLLPEQKLIYDKIIHAAAVEEGGFFFLDAPGGTGKTFLISLILAQIRSHGNIALAIASSGIAATLLDGGRTAHSALKLPLNIQTNENAVCNIKSHSGMANVLKRSKIVIWDECTMAHKHSLEALNRTLKDLRGNDRLFGGALILLSGDFRQTLPLIPRSTHADEINACFKSSSLWRSVTKLNLKKNMRIQIQNDPSAEQFSKHLLDIGDGKMPINQTTQMLKLTDEFCTIMPSRDLLIQNVFPNLQSNFKNHQWLSERAILAARNVDVDSINIKIQLEHIQSENFTFKSIDKVIEENEAVNFSTEFLNSLDLQGLPPHKLHLKIGSPIILLRNLNAPKLCNGTRLVVQKIFGNMIEATIINGKFKGEHILLPRIPMIPNESPIQFKRIQFPIRLAFAMTINKAQGQSMKICGLDLENSCFSHGQLYVACSRVGKPNDLFIYAENRKTKNIVHTLALQ